MRPFVTTSGVDAPLRVTRDEDGGYYFLRTLPVVVWFERPIFIKSQVFRLLICKLREVGVKRREVKARHILIWKGK